MENGNISRQTAPAYTNPPPPAVLGANVPEQTIGQAPEANDRVSGHIAPSSAYGPTNTVPGTRLQSPSLLQAARFKALMRYCTAGDLNAVDRLINSVDINAHAPDTGKTLLHIAAQRGHAEIVEFLMGRGANADARDRLGRTPLHLAAWSKKSDAGKLLTNAANVDARDQHGLTPLHYAVRFGKYALTEHLICDKGADRHARDNMGNTPAHFIKTLPLYNLLDAENINFLAVNNSGLSPLETVGNNPAVDVAVVTALAGKQLTARGLPFRSDNIHVAAATGDLRSLRDLLRAPGVWINARDESYDTPLMHAVKNRQSAVVDLLIQHGAIVNIANNTFRTPLRESIERGEHRITQTLLANGANSTEVAHDNVAPFEAAATKADRKAHFLCDAPHEKVVKLESMSRPGLLKSLMQREITGKR